MISLSQLLLFAGASLLMALTPGPNMLYLLSRSLCQGRVAAIMSWGGVVLGFTVHMLCAAIGLTALFMAIPMGYELLKVAGALYLLWIAWQGIKPGSRSPFEPAPLVTHSPGRLFLMGLLTSVLNPQGRHLLSVGVAPVHLAGCGHGTGPELAARHSANSYQRGRQPLGGLVRRPS